MQSDPLPTAVRQKIEPYPLLDKDASSSSIDGIKTPTNRCKRSKEEMDLINTEWRKNNPPAHKSPPPTRDQYHWFGDSWLTEEPKSYPGPQTEAPTGKTTKSKKSVGFKEQAPVPPPSFQRGQARLSRALHRDAQQSSTVTGERCQRLLGRSPNALGCYEKVLTPESLLSQSTKRIPMSTFVPESSPMKFACTV